jgi:molybdate/tungstate transport system substrate-binding protein
MRRRVFRDFHRALRPLAALLCALTAVTGCSPSREGDDAGPLVVFNAGSLARPLRAALDTFARREGVTVEQESAGSLETARKLTELGKVPDLIALADAEVFPGYLVPGHVSGYVEFARNRMVLAYTDRSAHAAEMSPATWWRIVLRPDVEVGRSDPELDPNGYRTLLTWQLAELHYSEPGLARRLRDRSPARNVRPKEADLVGLLEAGEFDYIWSYESMARAIGLRYVTLPPEIDLSEVALADSYERASVEVRGARQGETVTFRGQPITYAFAVPDSAPHRALGERFAAFLLSEEGRALLRREGLDALAAPVARGTRAAWMP